jgi:hypothetical protein
MTYSPLIKLLLTITILLSSLPLLDPLPTGVIIETLSHLVPHILQRPCPLTLLATSLPPSPPCSHYQPLRTTTGQHGPLYQICSHPPQALPSILISVVAFSHTIPSTKSLAPAQSWDRNFNTHFLALVKTQTTTTTTMTQSEDTEHQPHHDHRAY